MVCEEPELGEMVGKTLSFSNMFFSKPDPSLSLLVEVNQDIGTQLTEHMFI